MVNKDFDRLSTTLYALSDPTRRAILARLALGESAVGELAQPFDMTLPAISKHLKVLERAGLIARGREAQRRPCRLEAAPLREVSEWVTAYRQFWEQQFEQLARYLGETTTPDGDSSWPTPVSSKRTRSREKRPRANSRSAGSSKPRQSGSSKRGRPRKS